MFIVYNVLASERALALAVVNLCKKTPYWRHEPHRLLKHEPHRLLKHEPHRLLKHEPHRLLKHEPQGLLKCEPHRLWKHEPQKFFEHIGQQTMSAKNRLMQMGYKWYSLAHEPQRL